jgi:hypothetical protein
MRNRETPGYIVNQLGQWSQRGVDRSAGTSSVTGVMQMHQTPSGYASVDSQPMVVTDALEVARTSHNSITPTMIATAAASVLREARGGNHRFNMMVVDVLIFLVAEAELTTIPSQTPSFQPSSVQGPVTWNSESGIAPTLLLTRKTESNSDLDSGGHQQCSNLATDPLVMSVIANIVMNVQDDDDEDLRRSGQAEGGFEFEVAAAKLKLDSDSADDLSNEEKDTLWDLILWDAGSASSD